MSYVSVFIFLLSHDFEKLSFVTLTFTNIIKFVRKRLTQNVAACAIARGSLANLFLQ